MQRPLHPPLAHHNGLRLWQPEGSPGPHDQAVVGASPGNIPVQMMACNADQEV